MPSSEKQNMNYEYFRQSLPELLSDPLKEGKYAVIYNMSIDGLFDTFEAAYREACLKYSADFIVQQIIDDTKIINFLYSAVAQ